MAVVAIVGTLDTKGSEVAFLRDALRSLGLESLVVDCSTGGEAAFQPDVPAEEVARLGGASLEELRRGRDRGHGVAAMAAGAAALAAALAAEGRIQGIVGLGGSAGTTIAGQAMRILPLGFPRLIVSTLASGDTRPYIGSADIAMLYSVVDLAGINSFSARVLSNAAGAIAGMVNAPPPPPGLADRRRIGATMFGVTTPCVTRAREILEAAGYEVLVFHATGAGGRALEALAAGGALAGVLDITTTELADELVGGVLSAGPDRLEAAGKKGIPQVVCPGAIDMVNFGPPGTVPEKFRERLLYQHNSSVTLMRTTPAECADLGKLTARKLNLAAGPTTVLLPLRGVSAYDAPGHPFHSPEANAAYRKALKWHLAPRVRIVEVDRNINDPAVAEAAANALLDMLEPERLEGRQETAKVPRGW